MLIVVAAILVLMTCWSFWGWCVGDSRDIRWIRHWCGGTFVVLMTILSAAGGFLGARVQERSSARAHVFQALQAVAEEIESGNAESVAREIRALDHRGDPDADAWDLLDELPPFTARLRSRSQHPASTAARTAGRTEEAFLRAR